MLMLILLLGCSTTEYSNCPTYPVGGAMVGAELSRLSGSEYPNTWEWIGRINKLRQELELCK
jgi:hypothetical protein